jgi:hypothetical protein
MSVRFPELGFYTLPGRVSDPRPLLQEVVDAERIGLGSVWISERQDVKEAAALSGAAVARTERAGGGGRRHQPQHPPSGHDRGVRRDVQRAVGRALRARPRPRLRDALGHVGRAARDARDARGHRRACCAGCGQARRSSATTAPPAAFAYLSLDTAIDPPPPLVLAALGPKSQALAGRAFDAALLTRTGPTRRSRPAPIACAPRPSAPGAIRRGWRCGRAW